MTNFFVNLCILISLIFVYLQFKWNFLSKNLTNRTLTWIDGIACGFLSNILMYFSIPVSNKAFVDLRYIPILLTYLYAGKRPALFCSIMIIFGRFLYGWNTSSITAFIFAAVIYFGFYLIDQFILTQTKKIIAMLIFKNCVTSIALSIVVPSYLTLRRLLPTYWLITIVGAIASIYIINYLRKSQLLLKKYESESTTDFLTGLNNVRQFDTIWNERVAISMEKEEPLALLFIDIDHFKQINDTYGHSTGDHVLTQLGGILKKGSRSFDIVSRNGGEEFSVILPGTSHQQALYMAEHLRKMIENSKFSISNAQQLTLTVSIGVASYPDSIKNINQLIKEADKYLYKAKQLGRNRVCSF